MPYRPPGRSTAGSCRSSWKQPWRLTMESSASAGRVASALLVLHDLFGMTFTDIAATVGRTPAAVRQPAARARAHIGERTPQVPVDAGAHLAAGHRFLNAAAGGDIQMLVP